MSQVKIRVRYENGVKYTFLAHRHNSKKRRKYNIFEFFPNVIKTNIIV